MSKTRTLQGLGYKDKDKGELVSSRLMAHQHKIGHLLPLSVRSS